MGVVGKKNSDRVMKRGLCDLLIFYLNVNVNVIKITFVVDVIWSILVFKVYNVIYWLIL